MLAPTRPKKKEERVQKITVSVSLNPLFTFSLFVEGRSNQMAAETCRKVFNATWVNRSIIHYFYMARRVWVKHI